VNEESADWKKKLYFHMKNQFNIHILDPDAEKILEILAGAKWQSQQAQPKGYSEEQMRELFQLVRVCEISEDYEFDHYLQSLPQPKQGGGMNCTKR